MTRICQQILIALSALMLGACDEGQETPATQVFVLVDLSSTWDRPEQADRNDQVLREVGHGIALAGNDLETPISVQYRVIGANSLEREPLCDVIYRPRLAPVKVEAEFEVSSRSDLRSYLSDTCPRKVEAQPAEPLTEIRTALSSVANQPAAGAKSRDVVIISDFLEETAAPISLDADLRGFHVILVYRPVSQDLNDPTLLRFRLDAWRAEIKSRGANVAVLPDTGLKRATLASFLTQGQ